MEKANPPWYQRRWLELSAMAVLFAVGFAIRGYALSNLVASPDELTYGSRAISILGSNWSWPTYAMWDQPPLFEYILAAVIATFGATLDTLRWVSVTFGSLAIVVGYYLGKSMYGRVAGSVVALAITADAFQILYSRQIYIEAMVTTLILLAILLFWEGVVKQRRTDITVLGGVVFGLALDSKYITLVMAIALVLFLVLYRKKIPGGPPTRGLLIYFGVGFAMFVPVLVDLAINNVDPFYFDLVSRFQLHQSSAAISAVGSGQLFFVGFRNFVQTFFRFSPTYPLQVFPMIVIDIPIWLALAVVVIGYFTLVFFLKRSPREGLLLILFAGFLAFAFTYPGKRTYFALYPSLIFLVMLGGLTQICFNRLRSRPGGVNVTAIIAAVLIALTVSGLVINAAGVPVTNKVGFGDWDEITPVMSYISTHHGTNAYVATNLAEIGYYAEADGINVSIAWMKQQQAYYSESPLNQSLQTPLQGVYPIYQVISPASIETLQPQFVVIPTVYYQATSLTFQQFMTQRYYEPLSTQHILLFEIRSANESGPS